MATYILLADVVANGQLLQAGTTQSTADVGGQLPAAWPPPPDVDPVDTAAIYAYFMQGPRQRGLNRTQFVVLPVPRPVYVWAQDVNGNWNLSGITKPTPPVSQPLLTEQGIPLITETGQVLLS